MLLVAVVLGTALSLWAQPRIVVDPQRPELDTVEFGVTVLGEAVSRPIYLINDSADTLSIPAPLKPYFSIERTPDQSGDVYDFLEFDASGEAFPLLVLPRQSRILWLNFTAEPNFYPLGQKRAALQLSLRLVRDTSHVAAARTLLLRAFKVELRLAASPAVLSADSVFLGTSRTLQGFLTVEPSPPPPAPVDTAIALRVAVRYRSTPPSENELVVEGLPAAVPIHTTQLPFLLHYRPQDPGPDTIELRFLYRRYPKAPEEESSTLLVTGFGVTHRWRWSVEEASPGVSVVSDTIDFGHVRLGNTASIRLRLRHEGNYHFHATDTLILLTPEAANTVSVIPSPFPPTGLAPMEELTLELRFAPHTAGLAELIYLLRSDLTRRLAEVPLEAQRWYLVLRGIGIGPRLQLSPSALDIRFPWAKSCPRSIDYTIWLRNVGTDLLQIDSLWLASATALSLPQLALPILLPPGSESSQILRVEPPAAGRFSDTLFVRSNVPGATVEALPIRILSLEPTLVQLAIPSSLRAKPGSMVWIPIQVDTIPEGVHRCHLVLSYDPSLLRWESVRSEGTALEGAHMEAREDPPGLFILQAEQPYSWLRSRSTLLELGFRAFLGRRVSTEVAFQRVQLGDTLCPDFWPVQSQSGRFRLDSVCGLEAKLLPEGSLRLELVPSSSTTELVVLYELPAEGTVELALFNAAGMLVQSLWQGQEQAGIVLRHFLLPSISPGLYFCRLRFGDLALLRPLFLWQ